MIHLAVALCALIGFALLLLAMARHQQDWLRRKLAPHVGRILRVSGFAMLALALVLAGIGFGWAYGIVVWCGWLSFGAALTVAVQTNREHLLARIPSRPTDKKDKV